MQPVLSILREVRDPRAPNARHELSAILFIALAATLCGQQSCVHIADFGAVNEAELAESCCMVRPATIVSAGCSACSTPPNSPRHSPALSVRSATVLAAGAPNATAISSALL